LAPEALATALRRYREERFCSAKTLAFGGVTLSGFLALADCFMVGCWLPHVGALPEPVWSLVSPSGQTSGGHGHHHLHYRGLVVDEALSPARNITGRKYAASRPGPSMPVAFLPMQMS